MDNKVITVALAVFVVVTVAACGGGDAPTAGSSTQAAAPAGAIDPASITDPGTISGTINFGGAAPEGQLLQMAADPYCITSHAGSEVMSQRVVVNDNGTLRHVFVYVKEGLGDQAFIASGSSIELSQEGCMYTPHVLGVQANQAVTIVNNDDTLHNINGQPSGDGNNPFNFAQPIKGTDTFASSSPNWSVIRLLEPADSASTRSAEALPLISNPDS